MSSSKPVSAFHILSFTFCIVPTVPGARSIYHACSGPSFSANDPFKSNLNELIEKLKSRSSEGYDSAGQAHGLTHCRGSVLVDDCMNCIQLASTEIRKRCPSTKAAIIWFDDCLLKYSDKNFFGQVDHRNNYHMCNSKTAVHPKLFNQQKSDLLSNLADEIFFHGSRYVASHSKLQPSGTLYGMVQCTKDIYPDDCLDCLQVLFDTDKRKCGGKVGARIGTGSCNIRYEIYRF